MLRNLAVGLAVAAALVLQGCGADSCQTDALPVETVASCPALRSGTAQATIEVRACPDACASGATCTGDVNGDQIFLTITTTTCDASSCPAQGCVRQPLPCTLSQPLAPGATYELLIGTGQPAGGPPLVASANAPDSCSL
jgi:hypothetical protein